MPESKFHEIGSRNGLERASSTGFREREHFRADIRSHSEPGRQSGCPTSGAHQENRRAEREDRHVVATNPETSVGNYAPTSGRHDRRRRALRLNINIHRNININIDIVAGIIIIFGFGRQWQRSRSRAGRNAHFDCKDAQRQRERAAKIQPHR